MLSADIDDDLLLDARRLGNNLAGQYKRGVGMAAQIGIGNFAGGMSSCLYWHDNLLRCCQPSHRTFIARKMLHVILLVVSTKMI